ncbi:MAG: hypothetical protein K0Q49_1759 [Haloplasmataceae bacterium]|jgi:hypothetical protein|nr:hypothetical protein [Haloplasmataceae bacterium]
MRVFNEIKKLFLVKAIWVIYLLLIAYLVILLSDSYWSYQDFHVNFVNNHGVGPYSEDLINDYKTLSKELEECNKNKVYDDETCQLALSERSKELMKLYSQEEPNLYLNLPSITRSFFSMDYDEMIDSIDQTISDGKSSQNYTTIEKIFFNKMIDYHEQNPRRVDLINHKYYNIGPVFNLALFKDAYLLVGGFFSVIMIILTISFTFSNDASTNIDYLILSSKTGRKILKHKLISSTIIAILITLLCFIPLIVTGTIVNQWHILFNSKMADSELSYWLWFDFTVLEYIIATVILFVLTNIFISILSSIISIYSKKLINTIVYNFVLLGLVIGSIIYLSIKRTFTNMTQLFRIFLNHTPYGYLLNNINMFEYNFSLENSYLTYREFPFVFSVFNIIIVFLLCKLCNRYYKKLNI